MTSDIAGASYRLQMGDFASLPMGQLSAARPRRSEADRHPV